MAYPLLRASKATEVCKPGFPLTIYGVAVYRVPKGGNFDLKTWTGHGGLTYSLDVEHGAIHPTQQAGAIY